MRKRRKKAVIEYDYEAAYNKALEDLEEDQVQRILQGSRKATVYATKEIRAGDQLEVEIYPEFVRGQQAEIPPTAAQKEKHRQVGIIYSAAAIALHRHWGWGKDRIISLADMTREVWHECAKTNLRSMPQMLEEETGVEVQCGDGTSWHQLAFLNADITKYDRMTNEQFLYMRAKQVRWVAPNVMSCLLLSLYRRCGFGGDRRLPRIANQIMAVQEEFGWQEDAIRAACRNEAGICVIDYLDSKEIEVEVNEA